MAAMEVVAAPPGASSRLAFAALRSCSSLRRCSIRARCEAVDSAEPVDRCVAGASLDRSLSIADDWRESVRSESRPLPLLGDCGGCIAGSGSPAAFAASRAAFAAFRAASSCRRSSIFDFCSEMEDATDEPADERAEVAEEEGLAFLGVPPPPLVRASFRSASKRLRSSMRCFCSSIVIADERLELGPSFSAELAHAELVRVSAAGDSSFEVTASVGTGGAPRTSGIGEEDDAAAAVFGVVAPPPPLRDRFAEASFSCRSASCFLRSSSRSRWLDVVLLAERLVAPPESRDASDAHAELVRAPRPDIERSVPSPPSLHSERADAEPTATAAAWGDLPAAIASLRACRA